VPRRRDLSGSLPAYAERVLSVVECIPAGKVLSYGDVAELLEQGGPRQVARVMGIWGAGVPWWRVLRADGSHAPRLRNSAMAALAREGTPLRPGGLRVEMAAARWNGR
jgi:alkylated DNA nucleotide flippase Atl1